MILSLFAGCGNDKPAASEAPKAAEESKAADATNAPVKPVVIKYLSLIHISEPTRP